MSKHDISKGVPITDIRVLPITLKLVERFCEELKRCKNNPDYLLAKTYTKTTMWGGVMKNKEVIENYKAGEQEWTDIK